VSPRRARATLALLLATASLLSAPAEARAGGLAGDGYSSAYAGESVFENKAAGESGQFSAIFFNEGQRTWTPGVVGLLVCLPDKVTCNVPSPNAAYAVRWVSSSQYATVSTTTAPGQNGFFIYDFAVPAGAPAGTVATFNGDVGLIASGALFRPEGYFHRNTTPPVVGTLTISPASTSLAIGGQQRFSASTNLSGNVGWSVRGGCGGIDSNGSFTAIALTSAGQPCAVVASIGTLTASARIDVFGAPRSLSCPTTLSVVANGGVAPNGTTTLEVWVRDENGNTVVDSSLGLSLTNGAPTLATLTPTTSVTAVGGVAKVTVASTLRTGRIAVAVSGPGQITACTAYIESVAAGAPTQTASRFLQGPIGADGVSLATLRVEVQDAKGDRSAAGEVAVEVAQTGGYDVCAVDSIVTGTAGTTATSAAAAVTVDGRVEVAIRSTTLAGTCAFSATPRTVSIGASTATLTTRVVGQPVQLGIVANDSPHQAGSGSLTLVTVAIQDALGTQVGRSTLPITATLDATTCTGAGGGNVMASSPGSTARGQAVFQFTSNGAYGACIARFATADARPTQTSMVFAPGGADHLGCAFTPSTIAADGSSNASALVTVQDALNNIVTAGSYSVSFVRTAGDGVTVVMTRGMPVMVDGVVAVLVRSATITPGADIYTPSVVNGTLAHTAPDRTCTVSAAR
jgi:hypothetical protein